MSDYQSVAPTTLALTLQDAKAHLNVSSTHDDSLITNYIKAATSMLETMTSRCFVTQTRVCKCDSFEDAKYVKNRRLYPDRSPLKSVSSVVYLDDNGTSTTMPSSDYVVSTGDNPGFIGEAYNATWPTVYPQPNAVTVTYVAGHSTVSSNVPQHVKQAIRMVVAGWYRNREPDITSGAVPKELEYSVKALLEPERQESYI